MESMPVFPPEADQVSPDGFAPVLEFYSVDTPEPWFILVLPGGGYSHRADYEGKDVAEFYNQLGFSCAVLQYRVRPAVYPAPQQDVLRAIRILRHQGRQKIAVLGFSAGGHLAASAGTLFDQIEPLIHDEIDRENCRPDALILGYPVISIKSDFGHVGSGDNLLGATDTPELRDALSLQNRVTANTPPAFVWHTATDQGVPCRNSIIFAQKLWELGIPAELQIYPTGRHGQGLAQHLPCAQSWPQAAADFLHFLNLEEQK